MQYKVIIVGAGIFGASFANLVAKTGQKVLVIDKREHIGGNAYSEFDVKTGIEVHKYGAHIFHTSNERVWNFVNEFSAFTDYSHRVFTTHRSSRGQQVFSLPINLATINQFFGKAFSPVQAQEFIEHLIEQDKTSKKIENLLEQGISLIGKPLFDAFIRNYTAKQWQNPVENLPPEIIKRLPVRYNYNNRYFNDLYEGLPANGYTAMFENMLNHEQITVQLNTNWFKIKEELISKNPDALIIYTGAIDEYFNFNLGQLSWRSVEFDFQTVDMPDFQGCSVMNYADLEEPYTRIIEFKHFNPERVYTTNSSVIAYEYSKTWKVGSEPYYPVNTPKDKEIYKLYRQQAEELFMKERVIFAGRLGEYSYMDMDKVFLQALEKFDELQNSGIIKES
ncbi:MAG: UDP-galactopyranose mutase [Candidatus Ancillula sp.]|jgi:UDP-galactopyranose mutase|nr:UDP-galactopyranose mutase [Candidatus Ancillula sp.]